MLLRQEIAKWVELVKLMHKNDR